MGHPVVHFEITGKDGTSLAAYYSALFGWEVDTDNPLKYGLVQDGNTNEDGVGIGGGIGTAAGGGAGHVTVYVEVANVDTALAKAASLGGTRLFGPDEVPGTGVVLGQFADPEGHVIGVMQRRSA